MTTSNSPDVTTTTPLERAILEYFTRIDAGETIARDEFIATHPDLGDGLRSFFEGAEIVRRMARGSETQNDTSASAQQMTAIVVPDERTAPSLPVNRAGDSGAFPGPFPTLFGQYRILRRLGHGAMGEVYLAEDIKLNRKVALKVPQQSVVARPEYLTRFTREAQACAGLRHHNICPVYEVNELNGIHYIAMAFIEGKPLSDLIEGKRKASPKHIAVTVRKIAQALEVAHRAGIIHRDLKPANIMIDTDGEPIVMDFGLARHLHAEDQVQLTQDGMILGTPSYMSPEQIRSEVGQIGPASDVYSLGVILYELLTGQRPFSGPMMSLLMDVSAEHKLPPKPSEVLAGCDARLEAICLKMISKRVADRYGSMKEVAAALGEFLKTQTTSPQSVTNTEEFKPVAATSDQVAAHRPVAERPASKATPKQTSGIKPPASRIALMLGGLAALVVLGVIIITITNKDGTQTRIEVPDTSKVAITSSQASGGRQPPDSSPTGKAKQESGGLHPPLANAGWHGWPADAPEPAIAPFDATQAKQHQEAWAKYLNVPVEYTNSIGMKFMLIPPGEFTMGISLKEAEALAALSAPDSAYWKLMSLSSAPAHKVRLTQPYYLGTTEVTQQQFQRISGTNPSHFAKTGTGRAEVKSEETSQHPVEKVHFLDVANFCNKLSQQEYLTPIYSHSGEPVGPLEGTGYRVPSEAEWEYACRAGTMTTWFSGNDKSLVESVAWTKQNSGGTTQPVGRLRGNPFGLHDVHGNVWEWCGDSHDPNEYSRRATNIAIDPRRQPGADRIQRGGDWFFDALVSQSGFRHAHDTKLVLYHTGFRVSLPVNAVKEALSQQTAKSVAKTGWHGWPADAPKPAIAPFNATQAKQHQEAWAKYLNVPVEYTNSIGMKFRLIPPGEFIMGSTPEQIEAAIKDEPLKHWQNCIRSEAPQHNVILTQLIYLAVKEVTQAEYEQVMGSNPSHFSPMGMGKEAVAGRETANHPVEMVSWNDAAEFCAKLSQQEKLKPFYFRADETIAPLDGTGYRLPSEAEWEFSCRAGTATKYWIGDKDEDLVRVGWFAGNSGGRTHAVGELKTNPFGLADIHGNVWEWVQDGWDASYYGQFQEKPAINPNSPFSAGSLRVGRGGDWYDYASHCRSSDRLGNDPPSRWPSVGFRVSLTIDAVRQALMVAGPAPAKTVPPAANGSIDDTAERQAAE